MFSKKNKVTKRIMSKNKIIIWFVTSLMFLMVPVIIVVIDPIDAILRYKLRLAKGTTLFDLLQKEIPAARLSLYIFNITNPDRFLAGLDDKLKLEEVGPFVFQEYRWYEDLQVSADGKEVSMVPKFRSEFLLEESIGDIKNITLNLPNLAMLCVSAFFSNYPFFVRFSFTMLVQQFRAKAINKLSVYDYLWGYDDPFVQFTNKLAPGVTYYKKLGLFDRLYDQESVYRITVGATDEDRFLIKLLEKNTTIDLGDIQDIKQTEQTYTDTYEGIMYPPNLPPELPLNLYRLGVCKTFNLEYKGSKTMEYGGEGSVYTISNNTFTNDTDPMTNKRYPDGVMSIAPCYYDLPFVVSKGHFLDADPVYLERLEGLKPDRNVHDNEIVIDKKVGVTYNTQMSLQLTLMLNDISYNKEAKMFSDMNVPVVHMKLSQPPMPPSTMHKFVLAFRIGPNLLLANKICAVIIGLVLLCHVIRSLYSNWKHKNEHITFEITLQEKLILAD